MVPTANGYQYFNGKHDSARSNGNLLPEGWKPDHGRDAHKKGDPRCPAGTHRQDKALRHFRNVHSMPWGGFKYSGVGREYGRYGIGAFLETRAMLAHSMTK
jgi:hypothetical protein